MHTFTAILFGILTLAGLTGFAFLVIRHAVEQIKVPDYAKHDAKEKLYSLTIQVRKNQRWAAYVDQKFPFKRMAGEAIDGFLLGMIIGGFGYLAYFTRLGSTNPPFNWTNALTFLGGLLMVILYSFMFAVAVFAFMYYRFTKEDANERQRLNEAEALLNETREATATGE